MEGAQALKLPSPNAACMVPGSLAWARISCREGWRVLPLLVLCRQPAGLIFIPYVEPVLLSSNTCQFPPSADDRGPPPGLSCLSPSHVSLLALCAQNPDVWAQKGHLSYLRRDLQEAKECYERTVSFVEDAADMHFVYLHLGSIYLEDKEVRSHAGVEVGHFPQSKYQ